MIWVVAGGLEGDFLLSLFILTYDEKIKEVTDYLLHIYNSWGQMKKIAPTQW